MLSRTVPVEYVGRHGHKRGFLVNILEVGANTTGTVVPENVVTLLSIAVAVDGAILVAAASTLLRGGRDSNGQHGSQEGQGSLHR